MRGELDDHPQDYRSLTYEDWCDLISKIQVKDEMKREVVHIKKIASVSAVYLSDSDKSARIPRRKKAKVCVLRSTKSPVRAHDRHHGAHPYCVLCKKAGIPERNYESHTSEDCTDMRTK